MKVPEATLTHSSAGHKALSIDYTAKVLHLRCKAGFARCAHGAFGLKPDWTAGPTRVLEPSKFKASRDTRP